MDETITALLPESHARAVRVASVVPHVRALFAHLPETVSLEVDLPRDPSDLPYCARQFLKLALPGGPFTLARVGVREPKLPLRMRFTLGNREHVLGPSDFAAGMADVAKAISTALFGPDVFARVLEAFAFQASNLETLQTFARHMLQSTDVDQALYVMLSGITSGYGLGFNRAALFVFDAEKNVFLGSKAIGPADVSEAHRIWEAIESEDKGPTELIDDYGRRNFDTRFQGFVQSLELDVGASPTDEVRMVLDSTVPIRFRRSSVQNTGLSALDPSPEFSLAAIRTHEKLLGLVFADNRYSGQGVPERASRFLGFYTDQTALLWENLSLLRRVESLARYDDLTGVFNRREFEARFRDEQSRSLRTGAGFAVVLLDVDRFKEVNDSEGHAAGDEILRALGSLLRNALRSHDIVARYGGDEFVVLLPGANASDLTVVAARLGSQSKAAGISISLGAANYPGDVPDPAGLVVAADARLYAAKRAGRGRARFAGATEIVF